MAHTFLPLAYALLLSATALAAPAVSVSSDVGTATAAAAAPSETVPLASDNSNGILWLPDTNIVPQAIRGSLGANILGPQNIPIDRQNADLLAPPTTDAGNVYVSRPRRDTPGAAAHLSTQSKRQVAVQSEPQPPANRRLGAATEPYVDRTSFRAECADSASQRTSCLSLHVSA